MNRTVRLQVQHNRQPRSNPYEPPEIELALTALKDQGLAERGWDKTNNPGVIRHETGPEIIVLVAALVEMSAAIIHLIKACRKHHSETTVNVVISEPSDIERVLSALAAKPST